MSDGSKSLPEVLESVVLGPEDRLILCVRDRPDSFALAQHVRENYPEITGRIYVVANADPIVLRATKAEGSTVGQCGDVLPRRRRLGDAWERCHLAAGHSGMHSDGTATWSNQRKDIDNAV